MEISRAEIQTMIDEAVDNIVIPDESFHDEQFDEGQVVSGWKGLFDLTVPWPTWLNINGSQADLTGAWMVGVHIAISAGGGLGWNSMEETWGSTSVDYAKYIYLKMDRAYGDVYIIMTNDLPDGTDTEEIVPLWYIAWDVTNSCIDKENIVDLRHAARLPGMA